MVELGSVEPKAEIPFVVEAWAKKKETADDDDLSVVLTINRTPAVEEVTAWRDADKDLRLDGCELLDSYGQNAPKKGGYEIFINLTTPYCPVTSDGKSPDLGAFSDQIFASVEAAVRKAARAAPKDKKVTQKDIVLENLDDAISEQSENGEYRFNQRQLLYYLRPIVMAEIGQELLRGNFSGIITDYENENGEIEGMYREPRGSISHPHCDDDIPLGTLTVEKYERPAWLYNKLLYLEKEGWSEALKHNGWRERNDCTVISSKGFGARAARDLVDDLAEHDEPVFVFIVHDADAPGTMIRQTFQEATKSRGARKIKIIPLGLDPWEAVEMGLQVETIKPSKNRRPVADYVLQREDTAPDGETWEEWLQTHRVELNAMKTSAFIAWLDRKMAEHGISKLIPPAAVITAEVDGLLTEKVRAEELERIKRETGYEQRVADTLSAIERPNGAELIAGIEQLFANKPEAEWREHVERVATKLAEASS